MRALAALAGEGAVVSETLDLHLLRRLARRFGQLQRTARACCTPASETQCLVLTELASCDALSVRELASRVGSDAPWVSRVVEQLRVAGSVERVPNARDRRQVDIRLTAAGRRRAEALQTALNAQADSIIGRIPPEDRPTALAGLALVVAALDKEWRSTVPVAEGAQMP